MGRIDSPAQAAPARPMAQQPLRDTPFADRDEAGRELAQMLSVLLDAEDLAGAVVLALPRGGVPVAAHVARHLELPLGVLLVRKLGAPGQPEYGIGALVEDATVYINHTEAAATGATHEYLQQLTRSESERMQHHRDAYRGGRDALDVHSRHVIVVDDGVATGVTALAAGRYLHEHEVRASTLAVPVAARSSLPALQAQYDRCFCLACPEHLVAVGHWYQNFDPPSDEQIRKLLASTPEGDE